MEFHNSAEKLRAIVTTTVTLHMSESRQYAALPLSDENLHVPNFFSSLFYLGTTKNIGSCLIFATLRRASASYPVPVFYLTANLFDRKHDVIRKIKITQFSVGGTTVYLNISLSTWDTRESQDTQTRGRGVADYILG